MCAAVWRGGSELSIEEVPVPEVRAGEVLVRVEACGICPTDIKKIDFALCQPPTIFGHETVGRVVAAGAGAGEHLGRRVALYHHVPCRRCRLCDLGLYSQCEVYKKTGTTAGFNPAGGGWAEYVRVAPWIVTGGGVVPLPEPLPAAIAILMEPLNTCLKCILTLPGESGTLVILGQGPVGLMLTALARKKGWRVFAVEPQPARRATALQCGAEAVFSPEEDLAGKLQQAAPPLGPDAVIAATDNEKTINAALRALRPGGRLILFAHTRQAQEFCFDAGQVGVAEKQILGSYSSSIELNDEVRALLADENFPGRYLVTHTFPLEEINLALDLARTPRAGSLKVAVSPDN